MAGKFANLIGQSCHARDWRRAERRGFRASLDRVLEAENNRAQLVLLEPMLIAGPRAVHVVPPSSAAVAVIPAPSQCEKIRMRSPLCAAGLNFDCTEWVHQGGDYCTAFLNPTMIAPQGVVEVPLLPVAVAV